ncbi:protein CHLOROPLAST IMPORT APPARATUS 2-like [Iris pallida]|uniref:Protein CHLOROPLAST IMPORT APPARATUS 2-like n=1 Tax=Iris pallida TaxID=29817 RepID=A0AAX6GU45_IRIPA|nr:protein CHLOROPLAST IMPORT APPARATUS 2-like [Iris pallida]
MSSPCLGTVERTCGGFELDKLKAPSPSSSSSARSSCSSECSSVVISTKRARTPRKRPNQAYAEAAILLSAVYPNVFNAENLPKMCRTRTNPPFFATSPPFPANYYLIEEDPDPSPSPGSRTPPCRFEFRSASRPMVGEPCGGADAEFQDPGSPDYDVESILDEEEVGEEGIDVIMGKVSTENPEPSILNPFLGGLMGFGIGGRFGLMLGQSSIRHAMRGARSGEWWSKSTMVEVKDIVPKFDVLPPSPANKKKKKSSKKKKKKVGKEELKDDVQAISDAATADASAAASSSSEAAKLKHAGLGLKLSYDNIVEAWSEREFPFTNETGTPEFSADALARLTEVDLTPDTEGGGSREASVQRFREKRRTRLFSKKIRYQVRKVNADCRPRMKASGRFVRRPSPLQDTEEGSQ